MLKTLLNLFSIISLVCAGLILTLCANQWFMYAQNNIQDEGPSIVEIFQNLRNIPKENDQEKESPLVSQAGEFALIINPPKPPKTKKKYLTPFSDTSIIFLTSFQYRRSLSSFVTLKIAIFSVLFIFWFNSKIVGKNPPKGGGFIALEPTA